MKYTDTYHWRRTNGGSAREPIFPTDVMQVVPWVDPVVDALGFDARSDYVELFWLGVIGPSTTWLMRRLAAGLDRSPEGFTLDLGETAQALGISGQGGTLGGRNAPFARTLVRALSVRAGPTERHAARGATSAPTAQRAPARAAARRGCRRCTRRGRCPHRDARRGGSPCASPRATLVEIGEPTDAVQAQLGRWRFAPDLCHAAARWAAREHEARRLAPDAA